MRATWGTEVCGEGCLGTLVRGEGCLGTEVGGEGCLGTKVGGEEAEWAPQLVGWADWYLCCGEG